VRALVTLFGLAAGWFTTTPLAADLSAAAQPAAEPAPSAPQLATPLEIAPYWTAVSAQLQALYLDMEGCWPLAAGAPTVAPGQAAQVLSDAARRAQTLLQEAFARLAPSSPQGALVLTTLAEFNAHAWNRYLALLWNDATWLEAARAAFVRCTLTGDVADAVLLASAPGWAVVSAAGRAWLPAEPPAPYAEESVAPSPAAPVPEDTIVYVTRGGSKYHRANCQYKGQNAMAVRVGEARAAGYQPCSRCW